MNNTAFDLIVDFALGQFSPKFFHTRVRHLCVTEAQPSKAREGGGQLLNPYVRHISVAEA